MNKLKTFLKNILNKYCFDKKFNSICLFFVELFFIVLGLIFKNYSLILWGIISIFVINFAIKKIYQVCLVKSIKSNIDKNLKRGDEIEL